MQKEGIKSDKGKTPLYNMLVQFTLALEQVAMCSKYGHDKYKHDDDDWDNFSRLDNAYDRYSNGLCRHMLTNEKLDESGLDHDAHVAWNALARLEIKLRKENDEKVKN